MKDRSGPIPRNSRKKLVRKEFFLEKIVLYFAGLIFYTIRRKNGGSKTKLRLSFENLSMLYSVFLVVIGLVLKIYIILRQRQEVKPTGGAKVKGLITQVKGRGGSRGCEA